MVMTIYHLKTKIECFKRNVEIFKKALEGKRLSKMASEYKVARQRIYQLFYIILHNCQIGVEIDQRVWGIKDAISKKSYLLKNVKKLEEKRNEEFDVLYYKLTNINPVKADNNFELHFLKEKALTLRKILRYEKDTKDNEACMRFCEHRLNELEKEIEQLEGRK
jgi:hypothetical protein